MLKAFSFVGLIILTTFSLSQALAATAPELPWICPSELGGSPEPVYTIREKGAPALLVCSDREFDRDQAGAKIELSLFKVLSLPTKSGTPTIHFNSKNENEVYRILAIERGVQVN
ncbi:MAG: hypothetical protein EOP04_28415, partial [Proteobacteria bacterium]